MTTSLVISVRLHDGRYHGADDWPPSPARLFQALIAGAARGDSVAETDRAALDWLERLSEPDIAAPRVMGARGFINFVPNNALDAVGGDVHRIGEVRTTKTIKPRLFDAEVPFFYVWRFDARDQDTRFARAICAMAEDLYQFGRGVDMAWAWGEVLEESEVEARLAIHGITRYCPATRGTGAPLDCPMKGSRASLERRFRAQGQRFKVQVENGKVRVTFTQAPKPRFQSVAYNSPPALPLFDVRASSADEPLAPWPLESASALVVVLRDEVVTRLGRAFPRPIAAKISTNGKPHIRPIRPIETALGLTKQHISSLQETKTSEDLPGIEQVHGNGSIRHYTPSPVLPLSRASLSREAC